LPENIFFKSLKNWDNKNWLSSLGYIKFFNSFLIKHTKLTRASKIIDIGCGRGKILGHLASKLNLKSKPIGIDLERHADKDKRINFKKIDALKFFKNTDKTFDLILIKQTIHFLKISEIKKLLNFCKNALNHNGKIIILTLDPYRNEIPTFSLMERHLRTSLKRDKRIIKFISNSYTAKVKKKFIFNVKISKKKYLEMIKNRYISTLLKFSAKEISEGIDEINLKYKKLLKFKDKLQCIIIKK
jgi:ubiquinone/menaquinone biosynthesis C-methylase UbiE